MFKELSIFKRKQYFHTTHSILQYNSTLFAEFVVQLLQGFEKVSILLTYKSNSFNVEDFKGQITHLIVSHKPYLVLGDFDINALRDSSLLDIMRHYRYTLFGIETTHVMGGLLDHIYIRNKANFYGKMRFQTQTAYYLHNDCK